MSTHYNMDRKGKREGDIELALHLNCIGSPYSD